MNKTVCCIPFALLVIAYLPLSTLCSDCYQEVTVQLKGGECSSNEVASVAVKQGKAGPKGVKGDTGLVGEKGSPGESCNCEQADALINKQDYINYNHNIRFRFPRHNNVNDWVKYMPAIPQLQEWTMCLWVTMYTVAGSHMVSYAYSGQDNGVIIVIDNPSTLRCHINNRGHYLRDSSLNFQPNTETHICVGFSQPNQQLKFYKDGVRVGSVPYKGGNTFFTGRGSLVFGQDQNTVGGGFVATDTFDGEMTNFMMWPRVLADQEINDVTRKCKYPRDVIMRPQLSNIEWNGHTEISFPETCPTL